MTQPPTLYHLVVPSQWDSNTAYAPDSLALEGFIHLSTRDQLMASARRFFSNENEVLVVEIAPHKLQAELLYEPADNQHFPHLYGPLNQEAVVSVQRILRGENGQFSQPVPL